MLCCIQFQLLLVGPQRIGPLRCINLFRCDRTDMIPVCKLVFRRWSYAGPLSMSVGHWLHYVPRLTRLVVYVTRTRERTCSYTCAQKQHTISDLTKTVKASQNCSKLCSAKALAKSGCSQPGPNAPLEDCSYGGCLQALEGGSHARCGGPRLHTYDT